ncbi:MAG TPA: hypothetical protein DCL35_05935, partial [Candidatus Omnitrophica bacterium]|nr:hypothetical protein [Candidatus Omnitrophota bacterium]
ATGTTVIVILAPRSGKGTRRVLLRRGKPREGFQSGVRGDRVTIAGGPMKAKEGNVWNRCRNRLWEAITGY